MRQRIILALLIAVVASSCQKKASGQTVAIVNNEEITAAELNSELTSNPNLANADSKEARNAALQKLISRKLLVQQAKADGLDKSPEYLNQQRRTNDDLLINMLLSKRVNTSQVPSADEIAKYEAGRPEIFSNREIWTLNQLVYPLPKDKSVVAKLAAAKTLDEVGQVLSASHIQFTRSTKKIDSAMFPHPIYAQIAALQPGEPFIASSTDKSVASSITAREPAPLTADQARSVALNAIRREQVEKVVEDRVKSLRASAKIEYQPGFGPPAASTTPAKK